MQLSPEQLEAVLAHEMAHVRRWDYLANLLQTTVECLLFFHPAVWWVSRRTRDLRELDVETGNIYESLVIMSKRANQISNNIKEELHQKLSEFASSNDNLEEVFENLAHRDYQDTTRTESPLIRADDAIILDNTNLTPDQQLQFALDKVEPLL